jgi:hypothetical protein
MVTGTTIISVKEQDRLERIFEVEEIIPILLVGSG